LFYWPLWNRQWYKWLFFVPNSLGKLARKIRKRIS
jgi:hypothetical protein